MAVVRVVDEEVNQQDLDCSLNHQTVRPNLHPVRHCPIAVKYYLNFDQREAWLGMADFDLEDDLQIDVKEVNYFVLGTVEDLEQDCEQVQTDLATVFVMFARLQRLAAIEVAALLVVAVFAAVFHSLKLIIIIDNLFI